MNITLHARLPIDKNGNLELFGRELKKVSFSMKHCVPHNTSTIYFADDLLTNVI